MFACVNQFMDCIIVIVQLEIHFDLPKQIIVILLKNSVLVHVGRGSVALRLTSVHYVLSCDEGKWKYRSCNSCNWRKLQEKRSIPSYRI